MSFKKTGDASSLGVVNAPPANQPKPEDKDKVAKPKEGSVSNK